MSGFILKLLNYIHMCDYPSQGEGRIIPILYIRKLRLRETEQITQSHMAEYGVD